MKKGWIAGATIAVLSGLNLAQGAALLTLHAKAHISQKASAPLALSAAPVATLPPATQAKVKATTTKSSADLHARLREVRHARKDLARYISSPHYNRAEAEKRFEALRAKSEDAQKVAQAMLLDAADTLTPADREQLISAIDETP